MGDESQNKLSRWRTIWTSVLVCSCILFANLFFLIGPSSTRAQTAPAVGGLHGQVSDPSDEVVPAATVAVANASGQTVSIAITDTAGSYRVRGLAPGIYSITITAEGFAPFTSRGIRIVAGKSLQLNPSLSLDIARQELQVQSETSSIDTSPDSNANAMVIEGKDLESLSDDPDELESELQALAGPAAGPNGGEIYVDGFTGGQIPPKSSIRRIVVNQNPFSAEYDRLGYGRIEIMTKPGTDAFHGHFFARGNDSAFNAQNPILNDNLPPGYPRIQEPSYYSYFVDGNIGGPLDPGALSQLRGDGRNGSAAIQPARVLGGSSFFLNGFYRNVQNVNVVDAIDPASVTASHPNGVALNQAIGNPSSRMDISPRLDFQLGRSNTLTLRYSYYRLLRSNQGIGQLNLPEHGHNNDNQENALQVSDSLALGRNFADNVRFQYRRIRTTRVPLFTTPSVNVQGSFVDGGTTTGTVRDNQDDFEVQDYFTGQKGRHALNFGGRLRTYRDANFTNADTNGGYIFQSLSAYLNRTPQQYKVTVVNNNQYTARALIYDGALFFQDDWNVNRHLTVSYGTRWETQNYISDKSDWAPRVYFAYAPGHGHHPKTVFRAGYGWFYERFTVPNSFASLVGVPYIMQTIHNNLPNNPSTPSNQQIYIVANPPYSESSPGNANKPPDSSLGATSAAATYYTVAPRFHSAVDMQGAIGVDRQISKRLTGNITYLYSRGVHQYLTNNINAPYFNSSANTYPSAPLTVPSSNIYQFQSGAVYRQDQIIATVNARFRRFSIYGFYTFNHALGDTSGVTHFPSNAHNPGFDYGRTTFDIRNRFLVMGSIQGPYAFIFSPFLAYNSGTPYNIRIGSDLTANNQFNARPTYAASCSEANVVPTAYGCLDTQPIGTGEKVIPYGLGTGPSNMILNLRVSKTVGFGPPLGKKHGGGKGKKQGIYGGGLAGRGLSGNRTGPGHVGGSTPRKYSVTSSVFVTNLFNTQNLGVPNGTLNSPFFGKSQSLAGGAFAPATAGNRSIFLQTSFNF